MKLNKILIAGSMVSGLLMAAALTAGSVSADSAAPLQLAQVSDDFDAARTYTQSCAACHNSGAAGAPRMGNAGDWEERLAERDFDTLVLNTINGYNQIMPPKGMCFTCSDEELELVVRHILDESMDD